jgi:hypothetical protein
MAQGRAALNRPALLEPPARTRTQHGTFIVQTYAVDGPRGTGISHYEIHTAGDHSAEAVRTILLTRNMEIYDRAVWAEGADRRFTVAWHISKRPDGSLCNVIDRLEEEPPK